MSAAVEQCWCDKMGSMTSVAGWVCICNQNCYAPKPCAVCGPDGCENGVSRQQAQGILAASINDAMSKARGDTDLEVDPGTLMNPRHYGRRGDGGMRTRKKS